MSIKIVRNEQGNCINFYGSSNPVYFNACLSGEVDPGDITLVNVKNDIKTQEKVTNMPKLDTNLYKQNGIRTSYGN